MWKRLQGHMREKDKQIGNPVLVETTYDEDQLRHIPNVSDFNNAGYQPHSPMSAPYNSLSPHDSRDYRASEVPTVSSVYSQPSPTLTYHHNPTATSPSDYKDISPPSSPEPEERLPFMGQPRRFRSMRDVSPVDEDRGRNAEPPRAPSNIPVLRKAPLGVRDKNTPHTQKFWGGKVAPNSKVKWDEFSGEPTSGNAGKAGQVSPGSYAKGSHEPPPDRPMGYHVSVTGPDTKKNATLSGRASRWTSKPYPVDTSSKPIEPWSRATGRVEIVQPLKDQLTDEPLKLSRKASFTSAGSGRNPSTPLAKPVNGVPVAGDIKPVADSLDEYDTHDNPIKPVVPLKVGRNSPPRSAASPTSPSNSGSQTSSSYPSPITPMNKQPVAPLTTSRAYPSDTQAVNRSSEEPLASTAAKDNGTASHFSWTTNNTSTTYQHSPPPSPPPPVPVSRVPAEPLSAASSILNRRRPIAPSDKVPSRKPVPSIADSSKTMESYPPSPRPSSTFSTSTQKALPRPPAELSAADHIEILESQMEDLRVRRSNVHRLLRDLNEMAPPNPMITDFKRMRLVDQRKKDFEAELAAIKREEHDVGLKLHRAWRKREKDDPGSESALWVRRVTR